LRDPWLRLFRSRPVHDDALERSRPPLIELEAACERLNLHLQVLDFNAQARGLEDQIVKELVVQVIGARSNLVQPGLDVQRLNQRVRIEQELQHGSQVSPDPAHEGPR
jgi:hypothetical protein